MQEKKNRNGGKREGAGRPLFKPTPEERKRVESLAGYGLPIEHIAVLIRDGIAIETLRKHFKGELVSGKAKANAQVGQTLYQKAIAGDTTAAIWWSKTQMQWKESQNLSVDIVSRQELDSADLEILASYTRDNAQ